MAFLLVTFGASLILNLAVLALLKIGLRDAPRTDAAAIGLRAHQPC